MSVSTDCFGFYAGGAICESCGIKKRCKAILVSNGMEIIAAVTENLIEDLPQREYPITDRITEMVDLMTKKPRALTKEEEDLLRILGDLGINIGDLGINTGTDLNTGRDLLF